MSGCSNIARSIRIRQALVAWAPRPTALSGRCEGHQWEFSQILRLVEAEVWGASRID